jgi:hypothetical protein
MLKEAVQQGRSECRGEGTRQYAKSLSEGSTMHGRKRGSECWGGAGEKSDFFVVLGRGSTPGLGEQFGTRVRVRDGSELVV